MPNAVRMTGAILRIHHDRGFAIVRSAAGDKYFAHASAFVNYDDIDRAHVGARVTFDPGPATNDLPQARRIRLGAEAERVPAAPPDQRREGTICRVSPARGFAKVRDEQSGERVFIHVTSMPRSHFEALLVGARVAFAIVDHERGPRAADVVLLD